MASVLMKELTSDIESGQFLTAITKLSLAINRTSTDSRWLVWRSFCYQQLKTSESLDLALQDVLKALDLAPNETNCCVQAAFVYRDLAKYEQAEQLFIKAIQKDKKLKKLLNEELILIRFKALQENRTASDQLLLAALQCDTIEQAMECLDKNLIKRVSVSQFIFGQREDDASSEGQVNSISKSTATSDYQDLINGELREAKKIKDLQNQKDQMGKIIMDFLMNKGDGDSDESKSRITSKIEKEKSARKSSSNFAKKFASEFSDEPKDEIKNKFTQLTNKNTAFEQTKNLKTKAKISKKNKSVEDWLDSSKARRPSFDREFDCQSSASRNSFYTDNLSVYSLHDPEPPTNIFGLSGLYVKSIDPTLRSRDLAEFFKKFGTIVDVCHPVNAPYAFIDFDNSKSPVDAISDLNRTNVKGISSGNSRLGFTFSPNFKQRKTYHSMSLKDYRKKVEKAGECCFWRSSGSCNEPDCLLQHIRTNKKIDNLPDSKLITDEPSFNSAKESSKSNESPTNIFDLRAIFINRINPNLSNNDLIGFFKKYGNVTDCCHQTHSRYAFIHFDNSISPIKAIVDLHDSEVKSIGWDHFNYKLRIELNPGYKQINSYHSMSFDEYNSRCQATGECGWWRSGQVCPDGEDCQYKHIAINKEIELPPNRDKVINDPKPSCRGQRPTNIFKHNGVFVNRVNPQVKTNDLFNLFKKYGKILDLIHPSYAHFAIVHFDNAKSPVELITELTGLSLNKIGYEQFDGHLQFALTPIDSQKESFNKISLEEYRKKVESFGECSFWRTGQECPGKECKHLKHLLINKAIEKVPNANRPLWL